MDGIWEDCLVPSKQQKVYQGGSWGQVILTSCGSLPLWNYPGIAPDLSWAGEEWLFGREKGPKGHYGSVKLEISNWRKISAFKANKPFANKTLRAGRKIRVLQSKPIAWKLFFRGARVTLCKKETVSLFKKGNWEAYVWLTVKVGQHEREFRDTGHVVLQETYSCKTLRLCHVEPNQHANIRRELLHEKTSHGYA